MRRTVKDNGFGTNDSGKRQFSMWEDPAVRGFKGTAVFKPALQDLTVTGRDVGRDDFSAQKPAPFIDDEDQTVDGSGVIDFYGGGHFHRGRQVTEPAGRIHWRKHWPFQRADSWVWVRRPKGG